MQKNFEIHAHFIWISQELSKDSHMPEFHNFLHQNKHDLIPLSENFLKYLCIYKSAYNVQILKSS